MYKLQYESVIIFERVAVKLLSRKLLCVAVVLRTRRFDQFAPVVFRRKNVSNCAGCSHEVYFHLCTANLTILCLVLIDTLIKEEFVKDKIQQFSNLWWVYIKRVSNGNMALNRTWLNGNMALNRTWLAHWTESSGQRSLGQAQNAVGGSTWLIWERKNWSRREDPSVMFPLPRRNFLNTVTFSSTLSFSKLYF